jgi:DNA polymerase III alpha subunit
MGLPQLRVRTGYSFREAYGRTTEVLERLAELDCRAAAMVDHGTWGHVKWEQAAEKTAVHPMFGMEVPILSQYDKFKPRAWILAADTRMFYRATSLCVAQGGLTPEEFGALQGVVRFPGGALHRLEPAACRAIDLNPSSISLAAAGVRAARATGLPCVITSYNDLPHPRDKGHAYAWEVRDSVGMRHIASKDEIWEVLQHVMNMREFDAAVENTYAVAEELANVHLAKAPIISLEGDLEALCRRGQKSRLERGHIAQWTKVYEDRLVEEIKQIKLKSFDSYFLVVADMVAYAKQHMLVGPARGSSAGSLVCYLMGITEVDPIPHNLLFQRFIDISRSDLPDIDIDFSDTKRHLVFQYLQEKYGKANVSKLGNVNRLAALSTIAQVTKKFGVPIDDSMKIRNAIIEYSSADERYGHGLEDTFGKTEPGRIFKKNHPEAADCIADLELHPSHAGVHAAGILVCNEPINHFCTVNDEGVPQLDKPDSEHLALLKIDALGLKTLGVIEDAGCVTPEELYSLKLDDKAVLDVLNEDRVSGIFQFEGQIVRSVMQLVNMDNFSKIDNVTALARPGPLSSGMSQKYIARASGREPVIYDIPQLEKYLKDTYGVFMYQEQIMSVVKEIGLFDWVKTSAIRKAMSGRKGEEYFNKMGGDFVEGAVSQGISEEDAWSIWQEMVTFGAWGFNKSHSVSYAIVTYWTCWLKRYHKLEYAAACLRGAKDEEHTLAILRELAKEGVEYTSLDPDYSDLNWRVADGRLIGGIMNAKGYGPVKALKYVQDRENGTLTQKQKDRLMAAEVLYTDLYEAHAKWGHFYADPKLAGVESGMPIVGIREVPDGDTAIIIGKLCQKTVSDENEPIRVKKRGGSIWRGQTTFLDLMLIDDSFDTPMRFRIRPNKYIQFGLPIAEGDPLGTWYMVKGWKISGTPMYIVKNIKKLS